MYRALLADVKNIQKRLCDIEEIQLIDSDECADDN